MCSAPDHILKPRLIREFGVGGIMSNYPVKLPVPCDPAISGHSRRVLPYVAGALTSFNSAAAVDNMELVVD
jgi:hypothetical protein